MVNRRIAILGTRGIPAQYGGFETFAEELSVRLVKCGIDVTVFCDSPDSEYKGVRIKHVRSFRLGPVTTIVHDLLCILKALDGYDVIYMLGYGAGPFLWIPRLFRKHIWVNMDGLEWKRSKWSWYGRLYLKVSEALAARVASLLIADNGGIKKYLKSAYGSSIDCHTIPYGANVINIPPPEDLIKIYELESFEYYLVVCRLEPENHVREIIKGFEHSSTQKKLIIVGNHLTGSSYVKDILRANNSRVRFLGSIYNQELLEAIRYYSFAYFHGHSVGGTNPSLLEALGCGNTIIAHDNPFNREVASDCALYFSSSSDIPNIIEQIEVRRSKGVSSKAQDRIRTFYAWDIIVDQYLKLILDNDSFP